MGQRIANMNDRGEKIVTLAREMLRSEITTAPTELKAPISFKVLCIAAIVAALGSSGLTIWFDDARRPVTRYERVELDALIFYAARLKGVGEDSLRLEIENCTGVSDMRDLTERDYVIAKTFLQSEIN
jgi:hypothetical protein